MKVFQYSRLGLENLSADEAEVPQPGPQEVLVKFHAASLNYRDLLFADGLYNPRPRLPAIPLSDGAGEVVAVGGEVTKWKTGDRVCPIFMQRWIDGPVDKRAAGSSLGGGGADQGVLREYGAFDQEGLVAIPDYLSYAEAATLPCAAVTAWHALVTVGKIGPEHTVLTLGTGGVSIFAIQIAKLFGAKIIATSSSDEKLERVRTLGADETINYRTRPEWDEEVMKLTDGLGVDHVVEVGGTGTLTRSVNAVRMGGTVSLIGVLSQGSFDPTKLLMKSVRLQGIFVGSRHMFEEMNAAFTKKQIRPVIDETFAFNDAPAALAAMRKGSHFGKIVIEYS